MLISQASSLRDNNICITCNSLGTDAFEGLRFLASFGPPGTGRTEGREKTQPFKRIRSRLFTCITYMVIA